MSAKSWKEKFYPVSAYTIARRYKQGEVTAADVVRHSITKWEGARKKNLTAHGVLEPSVDFDDESCSLCRVWQKCTPAKHPCEACPLFVSRGQMCTLRKEGEETRSPFSDYCYDHDPEPMIKVLKQALRLVNRPRSRWHSGEQARLLQQKGKARR